MPQNPDNLATRRLTRAYKPSMVCGLLLMLLVSTHGLSQPPELSPEPSTPPTSMSEPTSSASGDNTRHMRPKELLADELVDESHWLDTKEGKILALYRRTETRETKGALLLLHAAEDPQVWPPSLENLRKNLPKYGWETLAITLPQKSSPQIPSREETPTTIPSASETQGASSEASSEASSPDTAAAEQSSPAPSAPEPDTATPAREQLIKAYLLAALAFLNEKGQFNLVVLVDNSSFYWCMQLLSPNIKTNKADPNTVDGPLQALIIANLQPQEPLSIQELEDSFNQAQLPVLDIFFVPDDLDQQQQRELHKTAAMRNKLDYYQQLSIEQQPKVIETDAASFLVARVRGFMEKKAKGTEVKIKERK